MTRVPAASPLGTLYVEAKRTAAVEIGLTVSENEVRDFLKRRLRDVRIGTQIQPDAGTPLAATIELISFTGYSRSKEIPDTTCYLLAESEMEIVIYSLFEEGDSYDSEDDHTENVPTHDFNLLPLPNLAYDGLWQSLVFAKPIKELILRTLIQATLERRASAASWSATPWQSTILLQGPPGSGKSSLALALAQRLSIRLSHVYFKTKLLQVCASSLFSHLFGETMKRIGGLFSAIVHLAENGTSLIVVIVDEIESLVGSRELASRRNEPGDAIRATNEVLTGLDRCRRYENIVFIFTSNLSSTLDPAFVDRCRIEKIVDAPNADVVFEIMRTELNALISRRLVTFDTLVYDSLHGPSSKCSDGAVCASTSGSSQTEHITHIPSYNWADDHWPPTSVTAVSELRKLSHIATGLSGRKLKNMIALSRYEYLVDHPADLRDVLVALEVVVREVVGPTKTAIEDTPVEIAEHTPKVVEQTQEEAELGTTRVQGRGIITDLLSRLPLQRNAGASDG